MINSYSKIYSLGHRELDSLFSDPVLIEEKIDGSQFSFTKTLEGDIRFRSKGREIYLPCDDKLFKPAIDYVCSIFNNLHPGWIYRRETLSSPRHNALTYSRTPRHNIIIFDIDTGLEQYLSYDEKVVEAARIDLEVVPVLFEGTITDIEELKMFFDHESFLGGTKIEGMVIKNYKQFGRDKKTIMGKWVSEAFKEKHSVNWKKENPTRSDLLDVLILEYKHENRWLKAVQHLKEANLLENSPRDIGNLIKEVQQDIFDECVEEIKYKLWKWAWPKISRGVVRGLPEWWKNKLAESQFNKESL